jgi:hypothetical protein
MSTPFETIYATDLVYSPGCWQLCGNAHCCNFARYKSHMKIVGNSHVLMLLPGEFDYLQQTGKLAQFGTFDHRVVNYPLAQGEMKIDIIATRAGACTCQHDVRPAICRLYPLLPVFEVGGRLAGIDPRFTIFEEIEQAEGMERACKVETLPFAELDKFLTIAGAIGRDPLSVFYVMAYRLAKLHAIEQFAQARIADRAKPKPAGPWPLFEALFALRKLLNQSVLRPQLDELASRFRAHYGSAFLLA